MLGVDFDVGDIAFAEGDVAAAGCAVEFPPVCLHGAVFVGFGFEALNDFAG